MNVLTTRLSRLALTATLVPAFATPAFAGKTPPSPKAAASTLIRSATPAPTSSADPQTPPPKGPQLRVELQTAIDVTNEDPELHAPELRRFLDVAAAAPGVVGRDAALQAMRIEGLLYLARALLVLEQPDDATAALDEAIRASGGSVPNVAAFGPSLSALYETRRSAPELKPVGSIDVSCTGGPCRVFLDGRVLGTGMDVLSTGIPLGPHIVRIEPQNLTPPEPFKQTSVVLTDEAPKASLSLDVPPPPTDAGSGAVGAVDVSKSDRKLPRWAGILGMALGGAALAGGAFAAAIDGRCPDLTNSDPETGEKCRDVHNSLLTGLVVLGVGAGTLTGFGIAFGIGEVKDKRHAAKKSTGTEASLQLRWRF
ncbi:MAG: hypothetical protein KUG77_22690 [Nannocystaceae bacterium]|nr:hypothetical protein [Nannocystaceae bacterium]